MITHRGTISRVYLPPDANTLLSVADRCMRSWSCVNLVVIDKQPQLLSMDDAIEHCAQGAGVWPWPGNEDGQTDPDIMPACAGDVVTMETVAATETCPRYGTGRLARAGPTPYADPS